MLNFHLFNMILFSYLIAIVSAIIVASLLGLPIVAERPWRRSWTLTVIFPTPIIAAGLLAVSLKLGFRGFYNTLDLGLIMGILSALLVKYIIENIFPRPPFHPG
ncbi:MAG: energy-converting NiFe hydrogenase A subunit EhaA [Methanobacteriales archaeon]|uniref:Probable [NiFe]-hydrogenase-type-3 Eha complex membrane subunit A n=2 Tax=Methanothermobacter tenebrarum TaxID=680118 RepID=A0A328P961_9EURY|nr:energy-converting NiFe hydrogenase A subunit EhaA [Methanobacteriales archaeon]MBC7117429.1 energy-converting NiFe hydrogenase A subunit EhaA [Methanobacteriaceae archaeon]NPV64693.1 energy-converting NiFe hydrogenase A subunit EhaA [Methanobacteriaceae archaeon]RAO79068.1 iron hydrogenase [Methanothermobacter tenebrarum]